MNVDFGSAVETGLESQAAEEELPPELAGMVAAAASLADPLGQTIKGRFGVRPWLGLAWRPDADSGAGVHLGGLVSHQWWGLAKRAIRPAGETRLRAVGTVGGLSGWAVGLDATAGAWLGPVGLLVGPAILSDRVSAADRVVIPTAVAVGPTGRLALRVGSVTPWFGVTPTWVVSGDRDGLSDAPWDELAMQGGVVWDRRPMGLRATFSWRELDSGPLAEAALGIHIRPF